ncbi:MAG: hypothetical protein IJ112_06735 [Oscillospiraceae bacterium]|nr:hypothetical protein [Oscillospiraceae bacterium]
MNLNFKTARKLVMFFMIASFACAMVGLIFIEPGTTPSLYVMMAAFVLMVLALVFIFVFCRCPWCGRRIFSGMMKVQVCPHCKRDIDTGMKDKGKKKR